MTKPIITVDIQKIREMAELLDAINSRTADEIRIMKQGERITPAPALAAMRNQTTFNILRHLLNGDASLYNYAEE